MRTAILAATLAVALSTTGFAALTAGRGVPHYPAMPTRAHVTVGPVQILSAAPEDTALDLTLADAARARYGEIDGLAEVRTRPLPFGDGALVTGTAIRWD